MKKGKAEGLFLKAITNEFKSIQEIKKETGLSDSTLHDIKERLLKREKIDMKKSGGSTQKYRVSVSRDILPFGECSTELMEKILAFEEKLYQLKTKHLNEWLTLVKEMPEELRGARVDYVGNRIIFLSQYRGKVKQ